MSSDVSAALLTILQSRSSDLRDVFPCAPKNDAAYCSVADAIFNRQLSLENATCPIAASYANDLLSCEFSGRRSLAASGITASPDYHVRAVIAITSRYKVVRPDARRIVAIMSDYQAVGDRTKGQSVRDAMRAALPPAMPAVAVSVGKTAARPLPALALRSLSRRLVHESPKAFRVLRSLKSVAASLSAKLASASLSHCGRTVYRNTATLAWMHRMAAKFRIAGAATKPSPPSPNVSQPCLKRAVTVFAKAWYGCVSHVVHLLVMNELVRAAFGVQAPSRLAYYSMKGAHYGI